MPLDTAVSLDALAASAADRFTERFGRRPSCVAAAPGRVNLIGEHTDYNGGHVLPMAIDRYTVVAAGVADHSAARLFSPLMGDQAEVALDGAAAADAPGWAKYVSGVLGVYADAGLIPAAMDAVIESNVPLGAGLSSSAALEVALATAVEKIAGHDVEPKRRALLCQQAEHRAGTPCGVMDQFASALCEADRLLLLDCQTNEPTMQTFDDPSVTVLVINSNVKHDLTDGAYADRRATCEKAAALLRVDALCGASLDAVEALDDEVLRKRARHAVSENDRALKAAAAIAARRWDEAGTLMAGSHASLRDDYEVSCPEVDALVAAADEVGSEGGVIGSRITGGGFGGCTVTLVRTDALPEAAERIVGLYREATGIDAAAFVTRPARGAHLVSG